MSDVSVQENSHEVPALNLLPHISERERRFSVAYVEAAIETAYDGAEVATLAYFRAFPRAVVDDKQAAHLARFLIRRPAVKELVTHLRREMSCRAMVSASRVIEELERVGFANPLDYGRIDDKGQFRVDLSRTTHRQMSGLVEIETKERIIKQVKIKVPGAEEGDADDEVMETVTQRTSKIKFAKEGALDKLAKIHGLYAEGMTDPSTSVQALDRAIVRMAGQLGVTIDHVPAVTP